MQKASVLLPPLLASNPKAKRQWEDITPLARRDFLNWIDGAKKPETRMRRVKRACNMLAEGKRRPCCYAIVPMHLYKALGVHQAAKRQWGMLTPGERRDVAQWVDSAKDSEMRAVRIAKACALLAAGKRRPHGAQRQETV